MSERRYHHGNLRAALVDAGLELSRDGGPAALVLREATRRVGVSPNAAYRHFADHRALLAAVARRVQELMAERMAALPVGVRQQDAAQQALAQLHAVGLGYIEFALAEPGWFAVAFFPAPDEQPAAATPAGPGAAEAPPFQMLVQALDALVAAGVLDPQARPGAEWPCWSAVHGFAELAIHGPLRDLPADQLHALAERTVSAIIAGLGR